MRLGRLLRDAAPIALAAVVFVVAWKLVVVVGGLQPFLLPPPEAVGSRFVSGWADGTIAPNALTTLSEIGIGFAVGATTALVVGYLLARSRLAERVLSPYVVAAQSTPILALAPLFAVWFGPGLLSKVVMCTLIVFFPVAVATMVGIREVDRSLPGQGAGAGQRAGAGLRSRDLRVFQLNRGRRRAGAPRRRRRDRTGLRWRRSSPASRRREGCRSGCRGPR
ncbi:MAG TPA: ABC transporter permease subunit [Candidatus Limnocylindrales bacterium]